MPREKISGVQASLASGSPLRTTGLFKDHFLFKLVPSLDVWHQQEERLPQAFERIRDRLVKFSGVLNSYDEGQTRKDIIDFVLGVLGHSYDPEQTIKYGLGEIGKPDYALFSSETERIAANKTDSDESYFSQATALAEAKAWTIVNLDQPRSLPSGGRKTPARQLVDYLYYAHVRWGILTNGRLWRLYSTSPVRAQETYVEIDLLNATIGQDLEAIRYFLILFHRDAFVRDRDGRCLLDRLYEGSELAAKELEGDLWQRVFLAMEEVMNGFLTHPDNDLGSSQLDEIHETSLIFLYRILFLLFAESRGLLPVANPAYRSVSLQRLKDKVRRRAGESPTPYGLANWTALGELFRLINQGSEARGIPRDRFFLPPYNGRLFDPGHFVLLETAKLGNDSLAKALLLLSTDHEGEFVDYAQLSVRHLGTIYEGLLQYQASISSEDLFLKTEHGTEYYRTENQLESDLQKELRSREAEVSAAVLKRELRKLKSTLTKIPAGKVFLAGEGHVRRATGTYYTPESVVQRIVENALGRLVEDLKGKGLVGEELAEAILNLRVLDPAMGSGHFLVSAIDFLADEVAEARGFLHAEESPAEREDYENKIRREVLAHCVYGVDKNQLAVELAKVGLWLHTLTKDQPLSFLDHRLKTGDSVIGERLKSLGAHPRDPLNVLIEVGRVRAFVDALSEKTLLLAEIEDDRLPNVKRKEELYNELRDSLEFQKTSAIADIRCSITFGNKVTPKRYADIAAQAFFASSFRRWDRDVREMGGLISRARDLAEEYVFFHWELEFPDVFQEKGGFDAVIGNPPYVSNWTLSKLDRRLVRVLRRFFPAVTTGHWDLYVTFIRRGFGLLRDGGVLSFIVPTSFLTEKYGKGIRGYLLEKGQLERLIDFGAERLFEQGVRQYVIFEVWRKSPDGNETQIWTGSKEGDTHLRNIPQSFFWQVPNLAFRTDLKEEDIGMLMTLEDTGIRLGNVCLVNVGVVAHSAEDSPEVFKKNDVVTDRPRQGGRLFIEGKDISRFRAEWNGKYILYDEYREHFHRPKFPELFENEKVIVRRISGEDNRLIGVLDSKGLFSNDNLIFVLPWTEKLEKLQAPGKVWRPVMYEALSPAEIAGLLNSKVLGFHFEKLRATETLQGSFTGVYPEDLRHLPIPPLDDIRQSGLEQLVRSITDAAARISEVRRSFFSFLERTLHVSIDLLQGKSVLFGFDRHTYENFIRQLLRSRNRRIIKEAGGPAVNRFQFQEQTLRPSWNRVTEELRGLHSEFGVLEEQIDSLVFDIFGLGEDQRLYIRGHFARSDPEAPQTDHAPA